MKKRCLGVRWGKKVTLYHISDSIRIPAGHCDIYLGFFFPIPNSFQTFLAPVTETASPWWATKRSLYMLSIREFIISASGKFFDQSSWLYGYWWVPEHFDGEWHHIQGRRLPGSDGSSEKTMCRLSPWLLWDHRQPQGHKHFWGYGILWKHGHLWIEGHLWGHRHLWQCGYLWGYGLLWKHQHLWEHGHLWGHRYLQGQHKRSRLL